jgi:predicted GTPase
MKNIVKLFGIIALVAVIGFSMVSCDKEGGTLTIKNSTSVQLVIDIMEGNDIDNIKTVSLDAGASKMWTYEVFVGIDVYARDLSTNKSFYKRVYIEKGNDVTVTITDADLKER